MAQDFALIDAGGANLGSVTYALQRLGVSPRIVRHGSELGQPQRILLPGVGAAGQAMRLLRERELLEPLKNSSVPLMGICLGMQLLFSHSDEGDVDCLGFIQGTVSKLTASADIRVPHMGWNALQVRRDSALLAGIASGQQAYFVHSYAAPVTDACIASSQHGQAFAAIVQHGRVCGAQFHPERSAALGARLLANFLELTP